MTTRKSLGLLCLLFALIAVPWSTHSAQHISVASDEPVSLSVEWCATSPGVHIDVLREQGCDWQLLDKSSVIRGFDARTFWLKLFLRNDSDEDVERWLEVGHPNMAHISLYREGLSGWDVRHIGYRTPMVDRGSIESTYGVLSVRLSAHESQTAWVRLSSSTLISLYSEIWKPDEFRHQQQLRQFWVGLGIGGMGLVIVFSLMMLVLMRQVTYGFFALGQFGILLMVCITGGVFQRFFWPQTVPMTSMLSDLGSLIILMGMYYFLRAFLPQLHRYPILLMQFRIVVYASGLLIFLDFIDVVASDALRFVSTLLCATYATLLSALAWRDGDRAAGIILVAFVNLLAFAVTRLFVLFGFIDFSPKLALLPFLSIFLISPLMLLGLVDRTRQLQGEITRVRAESAAQLRFLAHMSHELRSPLDIVLGNAQLLSREARSAEQVSGLNSIFDSGRQLLRIIDHILDYARGAAGMLKIEPAPLRLSNFLQGIERMARLMAMQRNNRFEMRLTGEPQSLQALHVMADAERLRQVLSNLLANAARHTGDGVIALTVTALPSPNVNSGMALEFIVSDTGEGISKEEQERIFRPFERADSKVNYRGKGAGLGLAIARQLVELMGGQLHVQSAPQQGATFAFSVPVQCLSGESASSDEWLDGFDAVGYLGSRRVVLVVDDDALGRGILCQLLHSLSFDVIHASSGNQAVALVAQRPVLDIVLTDQYMPDGDGWLVLERVAEFMPHVPVVMMSAAPPCPPPHWSGQLRFAAEFLRPIDHAQLLARIADLLDLRWSDRPQIHDDGVRLDVAAEQPKPAMVLPDASHLQALAKFVELGQVTAIDEWVRSLQAMHPKYNVLAEHVQDALHRLDFPALEKFLAKQIEAAEQA